MWEDILYYDSNSPSGLYWIGGASKPAGKVVGYINIMRKGTEMEYHRWQTMINYKSFLCHRIVYELHYGCIPEDMEIDHIDRNSLNNRIDNLRIVKQEVNQRNKAKYKSQKTPFAGVSINMGAKGSKRYVAQVSDLNKKRISKCFTVNKFGEEEALRLACEWREQQIKLLNLEGAGYTESHGK